MRKSKWLSKTLTKNHASLMQAIHPLPLGEGWVRVSVFAASETLTRRAARVGLSQWERLFLSRDLDLGGFPGEDLDAIVVAGVPAGIANLDVVVPWAERELLQLAHVSGEAAINIDGCALQVSIDLHVPRRRSRSTVIA